jgi:hypothetical protein
VVAVFITVSLEPGLVAEIRGWSGQVLQPGSGQQVGGGEAGGVGLDELDHCGAGDLRGDFRAELRDVLLEGVAGARRVGLDRRPAEVGQRRDLGR